MSTTLKTIRRDVWDFVGAEAEEYLRIDDIDNAINEAIREIVIDRDLLVDSAATTTIPDQARYDLTSSTIWLPDSGLTDSTAVINEGATFSSSDTALTVDVPGVFSVGQLIKIDDEILLITAISGSDLTVVRGVAETTAASHADGSTIYIGSLPNVLTLTRVDSGGSKITRDSMDSVAEVDVS